MIRKIQKPSAVEILDEAIRRKYARGADVAPVEYPRQIIEDSYESSTATIKPVGAVEGSAPPRSIRRDDPRFDRYA